MFVVYLRAWDLHMIYEYGVLREDFEVEVEAFAILIRDLKKLL